MGDVDSAQRDGEKNENDNYTEIGGVSRDIEIESQFEVGNSINSASIRIEEREAWSNKTEYILALLGMIIGFGNVWRFPYLCQKNGGVAFLIPCLVFLIFAGVPLFFIELAIGQRMQRSVVGSWNIVSPYLSGLGVTAMLISILLTLYYNTLFAWCISYFVWSWSFPKLPWAECKEHPVVKERVLYDSINSSGHIEMTNLSRPNHECELAGAAQYYWFRETLDVSEDVSQYGNWDWWMALFLVISWIAVYVCVARGTKSSGKVTYFTAVFPYVVLLIFFIRGFLLEDYAEGFSIFVAPQWYKLLEGKVWLDAGSQIFFSLGLGFGIAMTFASFNPRHNDCSKDAYVVPVVSFITSIFAACVLFMILGYKGMKEYKECVELRNSSIYSIINFNSIFEADYLSKNWTIDHINFPLDHFISLLNVTLAHTNGSKLVLNAWGSPDNENNLIYSHNCDKEHIVRKTGSGTGLVFITFAEIMVNFPPGQLWSIIFFLMMITLGIDSAFGTVEGIICCFEDLQIFKCKRWVLFLVFCSSFTIITVVLYSPGNGIYILTFLDELCIAWPLLISGLLECFGISYFYGLEKFSYDVKLMTGKRPNCYLLLCIKFITPASILLILIYSLISQIKDGLYYHKWRKDLGMTEQTKWDLPYVLLAFLIDLFIVGWVPLFAILTYFGKKVLKEDFEEFNEEELKKLRNYDEKKDKKGKIQLAIMAKSVKEVLALSKSAKEKENQSELAEKNEIILIQDQDQTTLDSDNESISMLEEKFHKADALSRAIIEPQTQTKSQVDGEKDHSSTLDQDQDKKPDLKNESSPEKNDKKKHKKFLSKNKNKPK